MKGGHRTVWMPDVGFSCSRWRTDEARATASGTVVFIFQLPTARSPGKRLGPKLGNLAGVGQG